jgi:hypothetical protein
VGGGEAIISRYLIKKVDIKKVSAKEKPLIP